MSIEVGWSPLLPLHKSLGQRQLNVEDNIIYNFSLYGIAQTQVKFYFLIMFTFYINYKKNDKTPKCTKKKNPTHN